MFTDQLAIFMRNSGRFIDKNPQDPVFPATSEHELHEFIPLAFNNFRDQLTDSIPLDFLAHNNKKVGEPPTRKDSRPKV